MLVVALCGMAVSGMGRLGHFGVRVCALYILIFRVLCVGTAGSRIGVRNVYLVWLSCGLAVFGMVHFGPSL